VLYKIEIIIDSVFLLKMELQTCYDSENKIEIGVDEAGRGPLFGRLYVAAAVLPKTSEFRHDWMKDSKKFSSKKKIKEVSEYIKANALAWSIQYVEHDEIDTINIRQSVFKGMHNGIREVLLQTGNQGVFLMIDGNDFRPYSYFDETKEQLITLPHETIEGGDNKYTAIAAASILAKVARDEYISDLCEEYPELKTRYGLDKNQGYGTKKHLEGILEHGISQWHRKTYGRCKESYINEVSRASIICQEESC
jgi:ribonuclease HII